MISVANLTVQFGEKPLFENVSVKFGNGHRYGLIGANGSGKTTFLRVLGGELEPTHGNVSVEAHARVARWLAPHVSVAAQVGTDLLRTHDIAGGLMIGLHRDRYR